MPCWNTEFFLVLQMMRSAHCTTTIDTKKAVWQESSRSFTACESQALLRPRRWLGQKPFSHIITKYTKNPAEAWIIPICPYAMEISLSLTSLSVKGFLGCLFIMSVPRSMQRMVTVPRGRGTSAKMKRRKGEISGSLASFQIAKSSHDNPSWVVSHGNKHLAHDIARQSGHTNFLFLGSAMNPDEHL